MKGLLLSRQWHERDGGQSLVYWLSTDKGPVRAEVTHAESVFFIEADDLKKVQTLIGSRLKWRHADLALNAFRNPSSRVRGCYFQTQRDLGIARAMLAEAGIRCFEADLRPTDRFLMERFIKGTAEVTGEPVQRQGYIEYLNPQFRPAAYRPRLRVVSLDIETSISSQEVLSIAVHLFSPATSPDERKDEGKDEGKDEEGDKEKGSENNNGENRDLARKVFMVGDASLYADPALAADLPCLELLPDEKALLKRFQVWLAAEDPDLIIGWNLVGFDIRYLQDRSDALGIDLLLGRGNSKIAWRRTERGSERHYATAPGRVMLDGIELLRTATWSFESFSLENVSRQLLGRGKLVHDVDARAFEIEEMFRKDKPSLAKYNLEDAVLVSDIFARTNLLEFAIQRTRLTGLEIERQGGSVAAFDFLYLPGLHRAGYVAPVVEDASLAGGPGGYVLDSLPGIYDDVVVLDFKSLYPSIIRTFHVDPLALIAEDEAENEARVPGFLEASFSMDKTLLPKIIEELWQARDAARKAGRQAESQAIKIIMNSFYGVLGTPGCRFFDPRLVSSITLRGHEILTTTRDLIEQAGYRVIYGDTDSVFVLMPGSRDVKEAAGQLAQYLDGWWRDHLADAYDIPSYLELELETHFAKFLMPRVRGSEKGSKKRYAGLVAGTGELVFKGLETVRSDWSPLAREFQQELYRLVFRDEPFEPYIQRTVAQVRAGDLDGKLILRRRMRRSLDDYTRNVPPHVRAARAAEAARAARGLKPALARGGWVEYVMTLAGPQPSRYQDSAFDYDFYIERQLAPIADAVLVFRGTSLAKIIDSQMKLF